MTLPHRTPWILNRPVSRELTVGKAPTVAKGANMRPEGMPASRLGPTMTRGRMTGWPGSGRARSVEPEVAAHAPPAPASCRARTVAPPSAAPSHAPPTQQQTGHHHREAGRDGSQGRRVDRLGDPQDTPRIGRSFAGRRWALLVITLSSRRSEFPPLFCPCVGTRMSARSPEIMRLRSFRKIIPRGALRGTMALAGVSLSRAQLVRVSV
jgi:hypothetical protein